MNSTNNNISKEEDDETKENVCRICRSGSEEGRPLFYPCKCSGSIKYIHEDCLLTWLSHSNVKFCELCKTPYSFQPCKFEIKKILDLFSKKIKKSYTSICFKYSFKVILV